MRTRWKYGIIGAVGTALGVLAYEAMAKHNPNHFPIVITENTSMDFGVVIFDGTAGTVTINTSGVVTGPLGYLFSGTPAAGAYGVTGQQNQSVIISFTSGSLTGPGTAMTVDNFTHSAGASPGFDNQGNLSFNVGADLSVNASQATGSYSGTFTVTVNY